MTDFRAIENNIGTGPIADPQNEPPSPAVDMTEVQNKILKRLGRVEHELRIFDPHSANSRAEGANINRAGDIDRSVGREGEIALVVTALDSVGAATNLMIIFKTAQSAWAFVQDVQSNIGEEAVLFDDVASTLIGRTIKGIEQQAEIEALTNNIKEDLVALEPSVLPRDMKIFNSSHDAVGYANHQNQKGEGKRANGEPGGVSIVVRIENDEVSRSAVFTFSSAAKAEAFVASAPNNQEAFEDIAFDVERTEQAGVKLDSLNDLVIEELWQPIRIVEGHDGDIIHVGLPLSDSLKILRAKFFQERNEQILDRWKKDYLIELSSPQGSVLAVVKGNDLANLKADIEAAGLKFELVGPELPE